MTGEPVLTLERVAASYGPFRALFDIDLSVGEGQALALLGANGAGKTTAARVSARDCCARPRVSCGTAVSTLQGSDPSRSPVPASCRHPRVGRCSRR